MTERKPKVHELKINREYYIALCSGDKKAEIRFNDRNYKVGDTLVFESTIDPHSFFDQTWEVTDVCTFIGLKEGYVMLSLK